MNQATADSIDGRDYVPSCRCWRTADGQFEVIPFGADLHLRTARKRGAPHWWIRAAVCERCGQHWLMAQDELINDIYILRKMNREEAVALIDGARWPGCFDRYDTLLKIGEAAGHPWQGWDRSATAALATAHVMKRANPEITLAEIVAVLGLENDEARRVAKDLASIAS